MICILHGYLLEGSGSNLWTRSIVEALCREGHVVHLMAQENHPDRYPFITAAHRYHADGSVETWHRSERVLPGECILHVPELGDMLPVYVHDRYEEFARVVPMVDLPDSEIEEHIRMNVRVLERIVSEHPITALHANHSVLQSVVAQRVSRETGIPYAIMPHGSALEFAVKRDERFRRLAESAFQDAAHVFVHGDEMRERVLAALPSMRQRLERFSDLHLGVDTSLFEPAAPADRPARIEALRAALPERSSGRSAEQNARLEATLRGDMDANDLLGAFAAVRDYATKEPDRDVGERLSSIDWASDATLLFVGRLISSKGIDGVIAALPLLVRQRPDLRLIVVGHGPLREPLEAMLWALRHGELDVLRTIAAQGRILEGSPEGGEGGIALAPVVGFLDALERRGELDDYLDAGRALRADTVVFTGYLTHRELRFLFPCCDAAVFPSVVREAGPLVFLEALASGSFPLGTYFGGMRASIDSLADDLPADVIETMKLRPDPSLIVDDIVERVPRAMELVDRHRRTLFEMARERYDWTSVARTFARTLDSI